MGDDFHYDLNSQERLMIMSCNKDSVVTVSHTSNPEFENLRVYKDMEALRDRTVKIDIPYLIEWKDEDRKKLSPQEQKLLDDLVNPDAIVDEIHYEHLHVNYDISLLDGYATAHICSCCRADWNAGQWSAGCPSCEEEFVPKIKNPCGEIPMPYPPQYQGHPVGTPPPMTKCTCDIMALMAQGCKCGWLDIEKGLSQTERSVDPDASFLEELKKM